MTAQDIKAAACDSVFDVAIWMIDRAFEDGEYLQPQKMQRLLYLSQAYYGALSRGKKLIPCIFVATALGPVEPTSWRIFENGRPHILPHSLPEEVKHFLDSIWRRFGSHSTDYLGKMLIKHLPFQEAITAGKRSEICFESMCTYYGHPLNKKDSSGAAPSLESIMRPKVMRSHKGHAVNVTSWVPKKRPTPD